MQHLQPDLNEKETKNRTHYDVIVMLSHSFAQCQTLPWRMTVNALIPKQDEQDEVSRCSSTKVSLYNFRKMSSFFLWGDIMIVPVRDFIENWSNSPTQVFFVSKQYIINYTPL